MKKTKMLALEKEQIVRIWDLMHEVRRTILEKRGYLSELDLRIIRKVAENITKARRTIGTKKSTGWCFESLTDLREIIGRYETILPKHMMEEWKELWKKDKCVSMKDEE